MDKQFICEECGRVFKYSNNLRVHLVRTHNVCKQKSDKQWVCFVCDKTYSNSFNLKVHKKNAHKLVEQKLKKEFVCDYCPSQYNREKNLKVHIRIKHANTLTQINLSPSLDSTPHRERSISGVECILCKPALFLVRQKTELENHLAHEHGLQIEYSKHTFSKYDNFLKWKEEEEASTRSKFVVERGATKIKEGKSYSFVCHRSGFYKPKGNKVRHLKTQGTCKIRFHLSI